MLVRADGHGTVQLLAEVFAVCQEVGIRTTPLPHKRVTALPGADHDPGDNLHTGNRGGAAPDRGGVAGVA